MKSTLDAGGRESTSSRRSYAPRSIANEIAPEKQGWYYSMYLMCMAGLEGGTERAGRDFAALRGLRDELQQAYPDVSLAELSMGMSGDFEAAIEHGATIVRVGSALFVGIDE